MLQSCFDNKKLHVTAVNSLPPLLLPLLPLLLFFFLFFSLIFLVFLCLFHRNRNAKCHPEVKNRFRFRREKRNSVSKQNRFADLYWQMDWQHFLVNQNLDKETRPIFKAISNRAWRLLLWKTFLSIETKVHFAFALGPIRRKSSLFGNTLCTPRCYPDF